MTQEALKLALEWAEANGEIVFAGGGMDAVNKMNSWANAIKEALAQPELCKYGQEPKLCTSSPMDCQCAIDAVLAQHDSVQAKPEPEQEQEPVAWMLDGEFYKTQQFHLQGGPYANQIPLYTAPPQRTWVGLTDEDVNGFVGQYWGDEYMKMRSMVRAIEAKLKEKNT